MSLRNINIVIAREYLNKVRKKSFLILTFVVPLLLAGFCLLPSLLMLKTHEAAKTIAVVDRSGIVMPYLEDTDNIKYLDFSQVTVDSAKTMIGTAGVDVVLGISPLDSVQRSLTAETYSAKPMGMEMTESISGRINRAVEDYRIASYGIDGLGDIVSSVKASIPIKTYTLDASGRETISESGVYMIVSMLLGMVIYMFVAMFSGMVMGSVIEEKSSRVVEVLVSSVKSVDLMFGKIIGVALVALTQFLLWIVLALLIFGVASMLIGGAQMGDILSAAAGAPDAAAMAGAVPEDLGVALTTLANMPLLKILVAFILFFILGYLLYASLFAAIGASVENEADSQQLQLPVTAPLLIGFLVAFYAFKAPDSSLVLWFSMIPFTSPIVMLSRMPFGVPDWQVVLSLVILAATFVLCAWVSAKIYRAGILMFGKKNGWKDLWKWLKM